MFGDIIDWVLVMVVYMEISDYIFCDGVVNLFYMIILFCFIFIEVWDYINSFSDGIGI